MKIRAAVDVCGSNVSFWGHLKMLMRWRNVMRTAVAEGCDHKNPHLSSPNVTDFEE